MSYRVLVIPENFRKDQYVLEPIRVKLFDAVGRKAKVIVCRDPLLGGIDQALRWDRIQEIMTYAACPAVSFHGLRSGRR
jgi:hypothetical protein